MKKLIVAFDLDGTLLDNDGLISNKTKQNIQILLDSGHEVLIATGRPYISSIDIYHELALTSPLITDNGASITFPSNDDLAEVRRNISLETMHEFFNLTKHVLFSALYNHYDKVYVYNNYQDFSFLFKNVLPKNIVEADFDQLDVRPNGFVVGIKTQDYEVFCNLMEKMKSTLRHRSWGDNGEINVSEVYINGVSKATALELLLKDFYSTTPKSLVTVGDGINDVEMVAFANIGIAMINGHESVKDVSNIITEFDNHLEGATSAVLEFIKKNNLL